VALALVTLAAHGVVGALAARLVGTSKWVAASVMTVLGNTLESRATVVVLLGGALGSLLLARHIARVVIPALASLSILGTGRSLPLAARLANLASLVAVFATWTLVVVWVARNGRWRWRSG